MNFLMENIKTIKLIDYGESFGARVVGIKIFKEVIDIFKNDPSVIIVFDFENISIISTGFAKELFGSLFKYLGANFTKRVKFKIQENKEIISSAILRGINSIK